MTPSIFGAPRSGMRPRSVPLLAATLATLFCTGLLPAAATPRVPTDPAEVLERLPIRPGDARAREVAALRAAVRSAPEDAAAAVKLGEYWYDLAMAKGDPRFIGYAEALMAPHFNHPERSQLPAVRTLRGQLRQYRHDFDGAMADFSAVIQSHPEFAQARAWRGAIQLVQARYAEAMADCEALKTIGGAQGNDTLTAGCMGLAQAYGGKLAAAQATLERSLARATDPANKLWLHARLGEVMQWRSDLKAAEKHYRAALALNIEDSFLLISWSEFLLDQKRYDEVVKFLAGWENSDALLLRLALAESALKLPTAAAHIQALRDRFAAARARGDTTHQVDESRFELQLNNNPARALELAIANFKDQKEPRDARTLLEAAIAASNAAAAQPARDWLAASGFEDPLTRKLGADSANAGAAATPGATAQPSAPAKPGSQP